MPVVVAVQKYRWMFGGKLQIYTDHQALLYFSRTTEIFGARRAGYAEILSRFNLEGHHKPGKSNILLLTPCHDGLTCPPGWSDAHPPVITHIVNDPEHLRATRDDDAEVAAPSPAYDLIPDGFFQRRILNGPTDTRLILQHVILTEPKVTNDHLVHEYMLNNHKIHFNNDRLMEDLDNGRLYVPDHKDLRE